MIQEGRNTFAKCLARQSQIPRFIKLENILRVHQNVYKQRILDKSERLRKQAAI